MDECSVASVHSVLFVCRLFYLFIYLINTSDQSRHVSPSNPSRSTNEHSRLSLRLVILTNQRRAVNGYDACRRILRLSPYLGSQSELRGADVADLGVSAWDLLTQFFFFAPFYTFNNDINLYRRSSWCDRERYFIGTDNTSLFNRACFMSG